eukprot:CAMPEP_0184007966 /NCGR_PEP_ID=MMETSP0954-20121128/1667_1 /TAXON_ID=627963 /ORGANISM="Aplanochytrium sp, Strain PBS07" /LENGTH=353 /DNA_ID=CAMNT_0026286935 /DNA_START=220 /DNA_END=1281 /DNA_ORIENTATION=-
MKKSMLEHARALIPALTNSLYKGSAGRIAVVGGSYEYCGAPFYAAKSTLRAGADLAFVFCTQAAATPIKSYSPELIVLPCLDGGDDELQKAIDRLPGIHALVLGPGLGRDPQVFEAATKLIEHSIEMKIPLVLDGDLLFLLSTSKSLRETITGYEAMILTPNAMEFERIYASVFPNSSESGKSIRFSGDDLLKHPELQSAKNSDSGLLLTTAEVDAITNHSDHPMHRLVQLARKLGGPTILQKGAIDMISDGKYVAANGASGSPRRCGGQGDILAGTSGVFLNWAMSRDMGKGDQVSSQVVAAFAASFLVRKANEIGFSKLKRSMVTPDMIEELGKAFEMLFPTNVEKSNPKL